jgi:hypothetical protein
MANIFAPFGFRQYSGTGSAPTYEQVATFCEYNTAAMYFGDPVYRDATTVASNPTPRGPAFLLAFLLAVSTSRFLRSAPYGAISGALRCCLWQPR